MARLFFACWILLSCHVSGQPVIYHLQGQMLNLKPGVTGQPDDILWKHNGNKAVEFNGREQTVYSPYEKRIELDWISAELNVSNLRYEDSGNYELEIFIKGELKKFLYTVKVIGKVPKPTISCNMTDGSSGERGTQATLMCSADPTSPQALMKFEWNSGGNVQLGPELTISLGDEHDDKKYTCRVNNPLTEETATFTAKDCYDKWSSVALAVGMSVTILILLLVAVGIVFCKRNSKACFAEIRQEPYRATEVSGVDDERVNLLDRAPTLPSTQRLCQTAGERQDGIPQKGFVQSRIKKLEGGDCGQPSPADTQRESDDEADEDDEAKSPPVNGVSLPPAQPRSPLTQSSPELRNDDTADEHKEDGKSDQVNGETADNNVRESDSPGSGTRNESDDSSEEKQLSTVPEQNSSEKEHEQDPKLSQEETHTREDDQIMDKTACEDESESDNVGEEIDTEQNLSSDPSQQPHSPTQTKADNTKTNTSQESLNTPHADPDQKPESKTRHDSDASEGQSDSSKAEAEKGEDESKTAEKNEDQCGPEEEERGNENRNEDEEGQEKAELVE